ncbi:MAG: ankyrin repeat domain-containing protein, partial [Candidatus Falkowbacteria bacterium]
DEIISFVQNEFDKRKQQRRNFELKWQLNYNFYKGNQYCFMDLGKNIVQIKEPDNENIERCVYNNIAPIIDTRRAQLRQLNKNMTVLSATSENDDINNAEISSEILKNTYSKLKFDDDLVLGSDWAEFEGSSFVKSIWDTNAGEVVGKDDDSNIILSGEVSTSVVSCYEMYPEDLTKETLKQQNSMIQAKVMTKDDIFLKYGIEISGASNQIYNYTYECGLYGDEKSNIQYLQDSGIVIEYYELPNRFYPKGRFITICENKIINYTDLPFVNAENNMRSFPFVKIDCIRIPGCFFGDSIIERLISVQESYNKVNNNINTYLSRAAIGVPIIEEDSIENEIDIVDLLIKNNANVNSKDNNGSNALIFVAFNGKIEIVKILIAAGVILNESSRPGDFSSVFASQRALVFAAQNGHSEIVGLLVKNGVDVNGRSKNGMTALMAAARNNHLETVKLLVESGADVNYRSTNGTTALIKAVQDGHLDVVKFLIEKGADVNTENEYHSSALTIAHNNHYDLIEELLIKSGAKAKK